MSVRTMAKVWEVSRHSGTQLLMLLAIADFADDDGKAWPSVEKLAEKCRTSPRNANIVLAALRASGELDVATNRGPYGTNLYRITCMAAAADPLKDSSPPPLKKSSPPTLKPPSPRPCSGFQGGDEALFPEPLKPPSSKPSSNHQATTKRTTKAAAPLAAPADVDAQVWADWLLLRKSKKAPVTITVIDEAREQAVVAGMSFEAFLRTWCARGWQSLQAEWLKPAQRGAAPGRSFAGTDYSAGVTPETFRQRAARERMQAAVPSIAAKAPGTVNPNPMEVLDGLVKRVD